MEMDDIAQRVLIAALPQDHASLLVAIGALQTHAPATDLFDRPGQEPLGERDVLGFAPGRGDLLDKGKNVRERYDRRRPPIRWMAISLSTSRKAAVPVYSVAKGGCASESCAA